MEKKDSLLVYAGAAVGDSASVTSDDEPSNDGLHKIAPAVNQRRLFPTRQQKRKQQQHQPRHYAGDGHYHVHWNLTTEVYTFLFDYTPEEMRKTWWQNPEDFNEMKMVTQFIGKASLDETVRRWFENHYQSSHSGNHSSHEDKLGVHVLNEYIDYDSDEDGDDDCCSKKCFFLLSWGETGSRQEDPLIPHLNRSTRRIRRTSVVRAANEKWWHQYGHSRRGVENIGTAEGLERFRRIVDTRREVVAEYRRQVMMRRYDPVQLSRFYKKRSAWARDLAIAAGASDANCVETDFDDKGRHSREFYLMKKLMKNGGLATDEAHHLPAFMKPSGGLHTPAPQSSPQEQQPIEEKKRAGKTVEMLKDEPDRRSNLAKQASGLGAGGASMGAVLSGMGNSSKKIMSLEEEANNEEDHPGCEGI